MRAWQVRDLGEPLDVMELVDDAPEPEPGPGKVVVDVKAAGLAFPDLLQVRGGYQVKPPLPFVPGAEGAGVVDAVGDGVDHVDVGQRVTVMGPALAEKVAVPAHNVLALPDELSFEQGACLILNYGTSVFAIENRGRLQAGETMLVTAAAGGVGSAAIQIGKALGARVIGLAGGPEKCEVVRQLGADVAIDYRSEDIVERVRAETDGRGVDVCYDAVGGDVFDQVRRTMAWDGRLLIIGFTSGRIAQAPTNHVLLKNYDIVGVHWGAWLGRDPAHLGQNWQRITELAVAGDIDPLISATIPLAEAAQGLADIGQRKTVGKLVVRL